MKKIYATVIYLFLLLSLLTGCSGKSQSNEASEPDNSGQSPSNETSGPDGNDRPQSDEVSEPESPYVTAVSEKQNFSTKHLKEYSSVWDDEDGLYIYTEQSDSIPYVLIWRYEDVPIGPGQFLEESIYRYMVESYGSDLIDASPVKEYSIGGKTLPGMLFTYKVGEYTVESLRLVYQYGDDLISLNAKYIQEEGDETMDALEDAVKYFTDGISTAENIPNTNNTPGKPGSDKVLITPTGSAAVEYVKYSDTNEYFSMDIPKGWTVEIGLPPDGTIDLISYAIKIYDPENADRRMYLNLSCAGCLKSEEARDWYNSHYPNTLGNYPIVSDVSTAGFFSALGEYYGYSDFEVTENIGPTALNGDLLNARAVSTVSGKPIQGLFTAMVTDMKNYVLKNMFDYTKGTVDVGYVTAYTVIYETAPEEEFLDWQPVLDHCLASLSFTDNFLSQRQKQWKSVMGTSSYIFNAANEISDMIMDTWETRNTSYDVISQKQSDATLDYERVLDVETGLYYKADAGFGDLYDNDRYITADDDTAYLTPSSGLIQWK